MGLFSNVFIKKSFKDPVCGMRATDQIMAEYNGQNYYFCSDHCKEQFIASPEEFVKNV